MKYILIIFVIGIVGSNYPMKGEVSAPSLSHISDTFLNTDTMEIKKCDACHQLKGITDYYKQKIGKGGLENVCKVCADKRSTKYIRTKDGLVSRIYASQRANSKTRNDQPPSYTKEELKEWIFSQDNFTELYNNWVKSGYATLQSPSCDRTNDYLPYSIDRLKLMTWEENCKKSYLDKINGINNKQLKSVTGIDIISNKERKFYSMSQASRITNIPISNISKVCSGERFQAGGYVWRREVRHHI